jgi:serine phosphatase RsbU (regulator of sigma subunit)/ligand-binding sensor domain-containing protein
MPTRFSTLLPLCLLLVLAATPPARARDGVSLPFLRLTSRDGLPQMFVQVIYQDHQGFLWFGTKDGLGCYDGYDFEVYRSVPFDTTSLSGNHVTAICEDGDRRFWVGTADQGLSVLDHGTGRCLRIPGSSGSEPGLQDDHITAICEDATGGIWVGSRGGLDRIVIQGLGQHRQGGGRRETAGPAPFSYVISHYGSEVGVRQGGHGPRVQALYCDATGTVWIGTQNGLWSLSIEGEAVRIRPRPLDDVFPKASPSIEAIMEDGRGRLWLGSPAGLLSLDPARGRHTLYRPPEGLASGVETVDAICESPDLPGLPPGTLWLGTYAGAVLFDPDREAFLPLTSGLRGEGGPPTSRVLSIVRDRGGVVWLGTNGRGVYKMSPRANRFLYPDYRWQRGPADEVSSRDLSVRAIYAGGPGDPDVIWLGANGLYRVNRGSGRLQQVNQEAFGRQDVGIVYAIDADRDGRLWIGTGQGLFSWSPASGERTVHRPALAAEPDGVDNRVFQVLCAPDGKIWLATARTLGRLDRLSGQIQQLTYDEAPAQRFEPPRFPPLYRDAAGRIWLGTNKGLLRHDPGTSGFVDYCHDPHDQRSLPADIVLAIASDPLSPSRYLWVGTAGGGLARLDRRSDSFAHVGRVEQLASDYIYGILTDDDGHLWLSTNDGLCRYDPATRAALNYGTEDGLQGLEFNAGAYFRGADGEMMFGGINGLNIFQPGLVLPDTFMAPVAITEIEVDGQPVLARREVVLGRRHRVISFEFAALSYAASAQNRYAYLLEGAGRGWIDLGTQRRVTFMNLAPGTYVFRARGSNGDGTWNPVPASVILDVEPSPWNTWWAWSCYLLLALGLLAVVRRYELGRVRMKHSLALLREDVLVAARIQRDLMPAHPPSLAGYDIAGRNIPNRGVGGDYYDFIEFDDDRLAICLGDVAGKGLPAALIMANFQAIVRSEAIQKTGASRCARRANRVLHRSTAPGTFITFFYAILDPRSHVLTYCNAGHERPLLVRRDGEQSRLEGAGLVLGVMEEFEYDEQRHGLEPGDTLMIYSDGISDAMDEADHPFGEQRLAETLRRNRNRSAAEVVAVVLRAVKRHARRQPMQDDMTLVVLKRIV